MKCVFLIGTSHDYQRPSDPGAEPFRAAIQAACQRHQVTIIAEEMSLEGLRNDRESTCKQVADALAIPHQYCDPSSTERNALGIKEANDIRICGFFANRDTAAIEADGKASHDIRRRCWLKHLLRLDSWPVLFVCGANHIDRFRTLLQAKSIVVNVLFEKWTPRNRWGEK